ncbi:MAG: CBS domain-containing protein [Proteobacteria bacterium]|nr:CBS domain-containing protein [Pseudomonadota bacterium]
MFHVWDVMGLRRKHVPVGPSERPLIGAPRRAGKAGPVSGESQPQRQGALYAYQSMQRFGQTFARDVMSSPVVTVNPAAMLQRVLALLRRRGLRHVPVMSEGKLVGMLSERDALRHMAMSRDAAHPDATPVSAIMRQNVLSTHPETPLRQVAQVMLQERAGAMPVVSDIPELLGIVTRSDILRWVVAHAPVELWA